jgi:hypothetical protein
MISHKHKFIFIHVPKTAGNSIQSYLQDYSEDKIWVTEEQATHNAKSKSHLDRFGIKSSNPRAFDYCKHTTLNEYYNNWPKKYGSIEDFFKFGVIRNPWDRAISYHFWKGYKSFNKNIFMNNLIERNRNNYRPKSCVDYFCVKKYNDHKLDYVIRFENIQQDFNIVCDKIGIPRQQLPHKNKSRHKHYTEYYDDETREIVAKKYAKDIEYFGYKFGE